jgi:site-specific recombinase XerD
MRDHFAAYRLRTYHNERTPWVFHHELDRRHAKAGTRLGGLRRAFAGAVKRAGLPEALNQHDLRHRRVTTWLDAGHPAHVVQLAMGHADIQTTLGYSHLTESSLKRLVEEPAVKELATGSEGI